MSFNKKELKEKLKNKDYSYCNYILHQEIKSLLIKLVTRHDKNFSYTNLRSLKNKCIECLDYDTGIATIEFYNLSMNKEDETYELDRLLDIYNYLAT